MSWCSVREENACFSVANKTHLYRLSSFGCSCTDRKHTFQPTVLSMFFKIMQTGFITDWAGTCHNNGHFSDLMRCCILLSPVFIEGSLVQTNHSTDVSMVKHSSNVHVGSRALTIMLFA